MPDTSQRTAYPEGKGRGRESGAGFWEEVEAAEQAGSEEEQTSESLREPAWCVCVCVCVYMH